jgi:hypothetical protein
MTGVNSAAQPNLLFGPSSVEFVRGSGEAAPAPQRLFLATAGDPVPYEAKAGYWSVAADWLAVTPSNGVTPATLNLSVDTAKLERGVYFGYVEIKSGSDKPAVLTVTLRVGDGAQDLPLAHAGLPEAWASAARLNSEPKSLNFRVGAGSTKPLVRAFAIRSSGKPLSFVASSDSGSWLAVGPQAGH